ncbi:MAG: PAS domain S-box protein [Zoogloeaceae bacterium]|nr:PAS domain S-box protein [Zoogloeaceae bacterium]
MDRSEPESRGLAESEDALRRAALVVSGAYGEAVLPALVRFLATALGADWAFVAVRDHDAAGRMHVLASWLDGELREAFDYELARTPCETVVGRAFRIYPERLMDHFPCDADFGAMGMQSYAGYPLTDAAGAPLGLIAAVSRRPLVDPPFVESLMKILAVRAAAELERARMDHALRASEENYRTIFEASEDCIFIHDCDTGAIVDVNPKACEVYGYDYATMLSMHPGDLGSGEPPYTAEQADALMRRALAGEVVRVEWRRRSADGRLNWDEVVLKRVRLGGVDRILAVTRDITARKESAEIVARSENRLRATIEAALDCIVTMDDCGVVRGFNPAAEACFGLATEDVLGRSLADVLIPERHREAHRQGMARYLADGRGPFIGRRVEVTAMRADGGEFPVELSISVADGPDGRLFVGYLRDITAQKRAEEERGRLEAQLRQAQKMEAIGQLAGGIAHDFNNLLTGIKGYLALAAEHPAAAGEARLARHLQQADAAAGRARDLIRQMLTFSRGRRGMPRPLSLAALVAETARFMAPMLPPGVTLEVDAAPGDTAVLADPVQVEQVVMNLCINARDAIRGAGRVRLAVRPGSGVHGVCASCRTEVVGHFLDMSVADDGPGIAPEVLERMFEPFFSTKQVGQGSGMGLAMVHGIVHEHGGHVLVDSSADRGTCFRVLLPPLPEAMATASFPEAAAGRRLSGRVLLVEDEPLVAGFLSELLETWGLTVELASDGLSGLERFAADPAAFGLVLSDQTMPRMTGLELALAARELRADLPVLLLSGYAEGLGAQDLTAVDAVLHKPVEPAELFALLARYLTPSC